MPTTAFCEERSELAKFNCLFSMAIPAREGELPCKIFNYIHYMWKEDTTKDLRL